MMIVLLLLLAGVARADLAPATTQIAAVRATLERTISKAAAARIELQIAPT